MIIAYLVVKCEACADLGLLLNLFSFALIFCVIFDCKHLKFYLNFCNRFRKEGRILCITKSDRSEIFRSEIIVWKAVFFTRTLYFIYASIDEIFRRPEKILWESFAVVLIGNFLNPVPSYQFQCWFINDNYFV